jgi:chromosome partitioning protein
VIASVNQKGGVGKTTATANLSVLLSQAGMRVLAVDLDPQGHLTLSLGHDPDGLSATIYDALRDSDLDPATVILETPFGPHLAPNNIMSSVAEEQLRGKFTWALCLAKVITRIRRQYDYILLDSGPNMGVLTVNCLCAADFVIIPTQMELLSVQGLNLLLGRIEEARRENPALTIAGAVGMMVQPINANRAVEGSLRLALGKHNIRVFETTIKRTSKFADVANERGVLVDALPRSEHAEAYRRLLAEILPIVGGAAAQSIAQETAPAKRNGQRSDPPATKPQDVAAKVEVA